MINLRDTDDLVHFIMYAICFRLILILLSQLVAIVFLGSPQFIIIPGVMLVLWILLMHSFLLYRTSASKPRN